MALESVTNVTESVSRPKNNKRHTPLRAEDLPMTVRIVRTPEQLERVCELRSAAYGLRNPQVGARLTQPEEADFDAGTVVLIAESKQTGEVVGTLRIHTNLFQAVPMEGVVELPSTLQGQLVAEACRFCVKGSFNSPFVRLALFKAIYLYCYANQVQFLLCVARKPLNELYKSLGFRPLNGSNEEQWERVSYVGNLEHSMLMLDVLRVDSLWYETGHPCYQFIRRTYHPDIQIFSAVSSVLAHPRALD
jgi:hypothetical protein